MMDDNTTNTLQNQVSDINMICLRVGLGGIRKTSWFEDGWHDDSFLWKSTIEVSVQILLSVTKEVVSPYKWKRPDTFIVTGTLVPLKKRNLERVRNIGTLLMTKNSESKE